VNLSHKLLCIVLAAILLTSLASAKAVTVGPADYPNKLNYRCDGIQDQNQIQAALNLDANSNEYSCVYLMAGTYIIDKTIYLPSNTVLVGDKNATIKLKSNVGWSTYVPMFKNSGNHDFLIKGFTIDANSNNQKGLVTGKGYHNLFLFEDCYNVKVKNMNLVNSLGDGLNVVNYGMNKADQNIMFIGNTVRALGHDVVYMRGVQGILVKDNKIMTRCNSAVRLSSSGNAKIFKNEMYSSLKAIDGFSSTGPGIEIDKRSGYSCDNVKIFYNYIHDMNGAAIWMFAEDTDDVIRGKNVRIFNNKIINVGQYNKNTGYSNAAITLGQFDNTLIENNYIDNGGQAGIKYFQYYKAYEMPNKFSTVVIGNTIVNCKRNVGAAIWNYDSTNHKFTSRYNNFYGNNRASAGVNIISVDDTSDIKKVK